MLQTVSLALHEPCTQPKAESPLLAGHYQRVSKPAPRRNVQNQPLLALMEQKQHEIEELITCCQGLDKGHPSLICLSPHLGAGLLLLLHFFLTLEKETLLFLTCTDHILKALSEHLSGLASCYRRSSQERVLNHVEAMVGGPACSTKLTN